MQEPFFLTSLMEAICTSLTPSFCSRNALKYPRWHKWKKKTSNMHQIYFKVILFKCPPWKKNSIYLTGRRNLTTTGSSWIGVRCDCRKHFQHFPQNRMVQTRKHPKFENRWRVLLHSGEVRPMGEMGKRERAGHELLGELLERQN